MNKKIVVLLLAGMISSGLIYTHPALISAFNLQTHNESPVPEFPIPALLVIISLVGMITITKFRSIKTINMR